MIGITAGAPKQGWWLAFAADCCTQRRPDQKLLPVLVLVAGQMQPNSAVFTKHVQLCGISVLITQQSLSWSHYQKWVICHKIYDGQESLVSSDLAHTWPSPQATLHYYVPCSHMNGRSSSTIVCMSHAVSGVGFCMLLLAAVWCEQQYFGFDPATDIWIAAPLCLQLADWSCLFSSDHFGPVSFSLV